MYTVQENIIIKNNILVGEYRKKILDEKNVNGEPKALRSLVC